MLIDRHAANLEEIASLAADADQADLDTFRGHEVGGFANHGGIEAPAQSAVRRHEQQCRAFHFAPGKQGMPRPDAGQNIFQDFREPLRVGSR